MIAPLILSIAIVAFAVGCFYITLSADLPDPGHKKKTRQRGWVLVGCFVVGVLLAGL